MLIKSRRSQAEIIVTILIILLVLAAIVIVWQVISNTVTTGANEIPGQTDCLTVKLDVKSAIVSKCLNRTSQSFVPNIADSAACDVIFAGTPDQHAWTGFVTLYRGVGTGKLAGVIVFIDGAKDGSIDFKALSKPMSELDTIKYEYPVKNGTYIKVAKVIGDSMTENFRLCDFSDNSVDQGIKISQ
jgi:hypothetical protein